MILLLVVMLSKIFAQDNLLPYQNPEVAIEERVADLVSRMTLAEKLGQMTLIEKGSITPNAVSDYFIGAVLSGGGGYPRGGNTPQTWMQMVHSYQDAALQTRLGIPMLYGVDAVHGHSNLLDAVIFPHNIGLGATRNPDLIAEIGRITAREMIATGIYWNYSPVLAVPQDIRWGRTYEGYSENTDLVTELSTAMLIGLQGDGLSAPLTVLATPKHFVGDGGTGGVLIIDNMIFHGAIFDDNNQSPSKKGVVEFTRMITTDPDWIVSLLPIRDGLLVAYKK
jgi:beta-glucosidase